MRRTVLAGLATVSVVGLSVATAAFAAPGDEHVVAGRNAAAWLGTQLEDDGLISNGFAPDIGLTIDAVLGMRAAGGNPVTIKTATDAIAANAATFSYFDADTDEDGANDIRVTDAGSTAKLL